MSSNRPLESLVTSFRADTEDADVSGMEHLQMLFVRDEIEERRGELSLEQIALVDEADRRLRDQAPIFVRALLRVVPLDELRRGRAVPPSRWWWYLDR